MPAQEDYETLSALAERLGLDDKEAENFIGSAMSRLGHRAKQLWEDATDDDSGNGGGGDFFSARRRENSGGTRRVERGSSGRRAAGGGMGWQYD